MHRSAKLLALVLVVACDRGVKGPHGGVSQDPSADPSAEATIAKHTLPNAGPEKGIAANAYELPPLPADAHEIRVSSAAEIPMAYAKLRDGEADRLLFERGKVYEASLPNWDKSGKSPTERMVIGAYGVGDRPIFRVNGLWFSKPRKGTVKNLLISGIEVQVAKPVGFIARWIDGAENVTVQDSVFNGGWIVQHFAGQIPRNLRFLGDTFQWAWAPNERVQGIYGHNIHGLEIRNCTFDHNGWGPPGVKGAQATMFNHNIYLSGTIGPNARDGEAYDGLRNVTIAHNLIANSSSIGVKLSALAERSVTDIHIEDNKFVHGEIGVSAGGNGTMANRFDDIHIVRNLFDDIGATQPSGRAFAWGIDIQDWITGEVVGNRFNLPANLRNKYSIQVNKGSKDGIVMRDNQ